MMKTWRHDIIGFLVIIALYSNSSSASDWTALEETKPSWHFKINKYIINNPYKMINFDILWEKTKNTNDYLRVLVYPLVKEKSIRYFIEDYNTNRCCLIDMTQQQIRNDVDSPNSLKFMIFFINVKENEYQKSAYSIKLLSNYNIELVDGCYLGKFSDLEYKAIIEYQNGNTYKCNNNKWLKNTQIDIKDYRQKEYQSSHSLILFCQKQENSKSKKLNLSTEQKVPIVLDKKLTKDKQLNTIYTDGQYSWYIHQSLECMTYQDAKSALPNGYYIPNRKQLESFYNFLLQKQIIGKIKKLIDQPVIYAWTDEQHYFMDDYWNINLKTGNGKYRAEDSCALLIGVKRKE